MSNIYIDTRNDQKYEVDTMMAFFCTLFIGPFYFLVKGMIGWFFISWVLLIFSFGFGWMILPFFASSIERQHYLKQGFKIYKDTIKYMTIDGKQFKPTGRIDPCL